MNRSILLACLISIATLSSWGARTAAADGLDLSVESDPLTFTLFRGWELGVGLRPATHWRVRATAFHQHIPQFLVDADAHDAGWRESQTSVALNVDYFVQAHARGGFHISPGVALGSQELDAPGGGTAHALQPSLVVGAGYQWFPFAASGFYVQPWAFVLVSLPRLSGDSQVGAMEFEQPPVTPGISVHVGFQL